MMNGIIIYQGKYGATEQYAQWLSNTLKMPYLKADDVTPAMLANYDQVILGSSVYAGKLDIGEWLKRNRGALEHKKLLLFIVCGTTVDDKEQQQKIIENNLDPAIRKAAEVFFLPGRCIVSGLSWKDRFVLKMGAMLAKNPKQKASMNNGFDRMDQKSLSGLIAAVTREAKPELVADID